MGVNYRLVFLQGKLLNFDFLIRISRISLNLDHTIRTLETLSAAL